MSVAPDPLAELTFEAEVIHWRGPSPFFFAPIPADAAAEVRRVAKAASYGWGVVPVEARIGDVRFTTSLFPKSGAYLLPLKDKVRREANVTAGDQIFVEMTVRPPGGAGESGC